MEEIFGAFDDDAFGETKAVKTTPKLTSYNAKICAPEWFLDESVASDLANTDSVDQVVIRKYRGDRLYLSGRYGDALDEFCKCEEMVPPNNSTVMRDVLESKVRCEIRLGQRDVAVDMLKLKQLISSPSNRVAFLYLELELFEGRKNWRGVVFTLQRLISLLPLSADLWIHLVRVLEEEEVAVEAEEEGRVMEGKVKGGDIKEEGDNKEEGGGADEAKVEVVIYSNSCSCVETTVSNCLDHYSLSPPPSQANLERSKCLWRLDREEFLRRCLIWAKLCLRADIPSISSFEDLENSSVDFASAKSASSLRDVETKLSLLRGENLEDESRVSSTEKMIGDKFFKLSTFDDHGQDFSGCRFFRSFFHESEPFG